MHGTHKPPQAAVQQLHVLLTSPHTLHFNMKWLAPCSHFLFLCCPEQRRIQEFKKGGSFKSARARSAPNHAHFN